MAGVQNPLNYRDELTVNTLVLDIVNKDVELSRVAANVLGLASGDAFSTEKVLLGTTTDGFTGSAIEIELAADLDGIILHTNTTGRRGTIIFDHARTTDGEIGSIRWDNAGDSVAAVSAHRSGANDAGYLSFLTQLTLGTLTERWRITSAGVLQAIGAQSITTSSGDITLIPAEDVRLGSTNDLLWGADGETSLRRLGVSELGIYRPGVTDGGTFFSIVPKGTSLSIGGHFRIGRTDFIADATNYERIELLTTLSTPGGGLDADSFYLVSKAAGTGTLRPFILGTHDGTTLLKRITWNATGIAFFDGTPVAQQAALTAQDTTLTHSAPGTPDFAIQDMTQSTPWGFASQDEGNTVLQVVANLQARLQEVEDKLQAYGLLA